MKPKYEIGERFFSESAGDCEIKDTFTSIKQPNKFVYEIVTDDGGEFVYKEEDL